MNLKLSQEFLTACLAIMIPLVTAALGYRHYLIQREHEIVRKRYLDEGLDLTIAHIEQTLSVYRYNWVLAISLIKQFRDIRVGFDQKRLSGFLPVDHSNLNITATHRLRQLVGDDIPWKLLQSVIAFVDGANTFFNHDLAVAIRTISKDEVEISSTEEEIAQAFIDKIKDLESESYKHYLFLSRLLDISSILEREKFTFVSIGKFKRRPEVMEIINSMKVDPKDNPASSK
ncbi:hypothetical protein [Cerasicoccus frondis]|uniref:hypothetical protein n=1 Tax=Cerasicoccus frondis TaxID=490090 RepID=UPI0028525845|nr:hypothetical protein [Cerasicoccus frondis]